MFNLVKKIFGGSSKEDTKLLDLTPEEFERTKFKARVAVVDDEEIAHVKRLRNEGYNISDYNDIDSIDEFIRKKYHVVVLDIQGIGKKIAGAAEGWGILKYLKSECPNIVVIMFTGADWSITRYKNQADLADDFIGKDLEYLDFKSKLDSAIKKAFSSTYQFEIARKQIHSELSDEMMKRIEVVLYKFNGDKQKTIAEIRKITEKPNVIGVFDNLLSIMNSVKDLAK